MLGNVRKRTKMNIQVLAKRRLNVILTKASKHQDQYQNNKRQNTSVAVNKKSVRIGWKKLAS